MCVRAPPLCFQSQHALFFTAALSVLDWAPKCHCPFGFFSWRSALAGPPGADRRASQMRSTKLPGNSPVLPFLCSVPLNQPSSRFLCTNTMSPSFSSSSASLWGGYDTTTLYLEGEGGGGRRGQSEGAVTVITKGAGQEYLSHIMGRASWCCDRREEQGWRGGGAMGAHPSRGMLLRWEDSGAEEEAEATTTTAGSGSRQLTEASGAPAP